MPAGRPTDYSNEVLEIANTYLDNYETEYQHAIPSVSGLAKVLKKSRDTLYDWAKQDDKKEFSNILRQIVSDQELTLLNKGLTGAFNPTIAKLVLGKHGYSEKQDQKVSGVLGIVDLSDKTDEELQAIVSGKG